MDPVTHQNSPLPSRTFWPKALRPPSGPGCGATPARPWGARAGLRGQSGAGGEGAALFYFTFYVMYILYFIFYFILFASFLHPTAAAPRLFPPRSAPAAAHCATRPGPAPPRREWGVAGGWGRAWGLPSTLGGEGRAVGGLPALFGTA